MAYPIRPWLEGMTPIKSAPPSTWQWDARQAANWAFSAAAQAGEDGDVCMFAYRAAWDQIANQHNRGT